MSELLATPEANMPAPRIGLGASPIGQGLAWCPVSLTALHWGRSATVIGGLGKSATERCGTLLIVTEPHTHYLPIHMLRSNVRYVPEAPQARASPPRRTSPSPAILPPQLALSPRKGNSEAGRRARSDHSGSARDRSSGGCTSSRAYSTLLGQKYCLRGCDMTRRYVDVSSGARNSPRCRQLGTTEADLLVTAGATRA